MPGKITKPTLKSGMPSSPELSSSFRPQRRSRPCAHARGYVEPCGGQRRRPKRRRRRSRLSRTYVLAVSGGPGSWTDAVIQSPRQASIGTLKSRDRRSRRVLCLERRLGSEGHRGQLRLVIADIGDLVGDDQVRSSIDRRRNVVADEVGAIAVGAMELASGSVSEICTSASRPTVRNASRRRTSRRMRASLSSIRAIFAAWTRCGSGARSDPSPRYRPALSSRWAIRSFTLPGVKFRSRGSPP